MIVYNNNCVNCSATCATCSKIPSNCTSCTSKFLFNNTCIDNCTSGYLGINNVCYQCNSNCRTCNGSVNNCSSCNSGYLVPSLGTCVTTCPSNLYLNPSDSTCIPCI